MSKNNEHDDEVRIKQINPRKKLNDLEKTAIMQFKIEQQEESMSKTMQFKMLNSKNKKKDENKHADIELPTLKRGLGDTIKIKLSELRANIEKEEIDLPKLKPKRSLYDTIVIKLDDLINKNNSLKKTSSTKVTRISYPMSYPKKFHLFGPKDITKSKDIHINVNSEEFGRQLYNLNKIALMELGKNKPKKVRRYSSLVKLETIEKVRVSRKNYEKFQKNLNKFAINKLYYKLAPKETKKYKLYKYCVMLSGAIFVVTSLIIVNWLIQGASINQITQELEEETQITETLGGEVVNIEPPEENNTSTNDNDKNVNKKKPSLYWKYLNTPLSSVDFTTLLKENKDTVGWIIVNNTNVSYPVVQANDNDYYLTHDFHKKGNSAGWVFADFRNSFTDFSYNTVIYAHGRKDKVMFGSLTEALKPAWYKNTDNQIIQFSTIKYNTMWQIFAIYKVKAESYYITTDFSSVSSYEKFISTMKARSIYDFGVDVNANDKLLTLSTCYNDNGIRLVIQAKLVKIQER